MRADPDGGVEADAVPVAVAIPGMGLVAANVRPGPAKRRRRQRERAVARWQEGRQRAAVPDLHGHSIGREAAQPAHRERARARGPEVGREARHTDAGDRPVQALDLEMPGPQSRRYPDGPPEVRIDEARDLALG